MHKYSLISVLIPVFSVIIFISAFFFMKPNITGLAIYDSNSASRQVNADVFLITKSTQIIPPDAFVQVMIDDKKAQMAVADFIKKTGTEYEIENGDLSEFGYTGPGFTGEHTYKLTLADFAIDRNIGKGEHIFITRIIYRNKVLYEKQNKIMISE